MHLGLALPISTAVRLTQLGGLQLVDSCHQLCFNPTVLRDAEPVGFPGFCCLEFSDLVVTFPLVCYDLEDALLQRRQVVDGQLDI